MAISCRLLGRYERVTVLVLPAVICPRDLAALREVLPTHYNLGITRAFRKSYILLNGVLSSDPGSLPNL